MVPRFIVASIALSPFVGAACTSFSVDAPAANEMDAGADAPSRSDADDADALTGPSDAGPLRRLFVIGGATDHGFTEKTYVGSIDLGGAITWRGGPSLGTALANGCAAAAGDRIHFVGGTGDFGAIPPGALMRHRRRGAQMDRRRGARGEPHPSRLCRRPRPSVCDRRFEGSGGAEGDHGGRRSGSRWTLPVERGNEPPGGTPGARQRHRLWPPLRDRQQRSLRLSDQLRKHPDRWWSHGMG